eukprot:Gb_13523 [translate_table: standard]
MPCASKVILFLLSIWPTLFLTHSVQVSIEFVVLTTARIDQGPSMPTDNVLNYPWLWHSVAFMLHRVVGNRIIKKRIHVRIEHVQPSRCTEEVNIRRIKNDALKAEAKARGEIISTKRQPEGPKPGFIVEGARLETVTPIPYDVVNDLKACAQFEQQLTPSGAIHNALLKQWVCVESLILSVALYAYLLLASCRVLHLSDVKHTVDECTWLTPDILHNHHQSHSSGPVGTVLLVIVFSEGYQGLQAGVLGFMHRNLSLCTKVGVHPGFVPLPAGNASRWSCFISFEVNTSKARTWPYPEIALLIIVSLFAVCLLEMLAKVSVRTEFSKPTSDEAPQVA